MAAQIEPTETDREFTDGISPECKVIADNHARIGAVETIVGDYARDRGVDSVAMLHAQEVAKRALRDGESAHRAIEAGESAVERMVNHEPFTSAYNAAKAMGVLDLCTTATGVAGHYQHEGRWFRVTLDAVEGREMNDQKHYAYRACYPCGCAFALQVDTGIGVDHSIQKDVCETGGYVERVTIEEARNSKLVRQSECECQTTDHDPQMRLGE